MANKLIIIGWGEMAEMAVEYFSSDTEYTVAALAAEQTYIEQAELPDYVDRMPVVPLETMRKEYPVAEYDAFVAIGYGKLNYARSRLYEKVKGMGYRMASYVSTKAFIGAAAVVGANCFVLENNTIQRNVVIGDDVFLWSGNHIGHGSIIENHVFLSSQVAVSGNCVIGEHSFLGIHAGMADHVKVARNCWIGAGVMLLRDTKENEIYRLPQIKPERLPAKSVFGSRTE